MHLLPAIIGLIDRRLLVNFRVRPEAVRRVLPSAFQPQLVEGWAIAGICLIRLKHIRPRGFPALTGIHSENAAHRIAVEWRDGSTRRTGVYIPRRDTSSPLQALAGNRIFPGIHHLARFETRESADAHFVRVQTRKQGTLLEVSCRRCDRMPGSSVFKSLGQASAFFEGGAVGYSGLPTARCWEGLELRTREWNIEPLETIHVHSSYFEDVDLFPRGTVEYDSAFLMRNIEHEWHVLRPMEAVS